MSSLLTIASLLAFPTLATSRRHRNYLRKTRAEPRLGRPEGFTWTNLDNDVFSDTSPATVFPSTTTAAGSSTTGTFAMGSTTGFTTSTTYWQLSTEGSDFGTTEIATLPTHSSTHGASTAAPRQELVDATTESPRKELTSPALSGSTTAPGQELTAPSISMDTTEMATTTVFTTTGPRQELTSPPRQELVDQTASSAHLYTWTATCTTDSDCIPAIRTRVPGFNEPIGAGICECYANSLIDPLDECQGDDTGCPVAKCYEALCMDASALCNNGVCELGYTDDETIIHSEDDTFGMDGMSMPATSDWCTDNSQCPEGQECIDESNGMCFLPPCGRCEAVLIIETDSADDIFGTDGMSMSMPVPIEANALNFEWVESGARRVTTEINLSMSMPPVLVEHSNFQWFHSGETSEEMVQLSEETGEFGAETGEFSLACNNHEDCVVIDGCCLSDGLCHAKTEGMPICWTAM